LPKDKCCCERDRSRCDRLEGRRGAARPYHFRVGRRRGRSGEVALEILRSRTSSLRPRSMGRRSLADYRTTRSVAMMSRLHWMSSQNRRAGGVSVAGWRNSLTDARCHFPSMELTRRDIANAVPELGIASSELAFASADVTIAFPDLAIVSRFVGVYRSGLPFGPVACVLMIQPGALWRTVLDREMATVDPGYARSTCI